MVVSSLAPFMYCDIGEIT